jgi:hypothetical protein
MRTTLVAVFFLVLSLPLPAAAQQKNTNAEKIEDIRRLEVLPVLTQESTSRGMEMGQAAGMKAVERWMNEFPELKKVAPPPAK